MEGTTRLYTPPPLQGIVDPESLHYRLITQQYPYSVKFAMNIDFSIKKGVAVVRAGTSLIGNTFSATSVLGSHVFYKSNGTTTYIIALLVSGVGKVYYRTTGNWTASNITSGPTNKYRFTTFNDVCYLTNGDSTNYMQASADGATWTNSANCLDVAADNVLQRRGKLIATVGDTVYISSNIDGSTFDWTTGLDAGSFVLAPFDGGKISGMVNIGRYFFIGKTNGVYRIDTDSISVEPDNVFKVGPINQECFVECGGKAYFWSLGKHLYELSPETIRPIDDKIDSILKDVTVTGNVFMGADERYVYIYIGGLIRYEQIYTYVVIKYDTVYNTFSFFNYPFPLSYFTRDPNTNKLYAATTDSLILINDITNKLDISSQFSYRLIFHDVTENSYTTEKTLANYISFYTKNGNGSCVRITDHLGRTSPTGEDQEWAIRDNESITQHKIENWSSKFFTVEWNGLRSSMGEAPEFLESSLNILPNTEKDNSDYKIK